MRVFRQPNAKPEWKSPFSVIVIVLLSALIFFGCVNRDKKPTVDTNQANALRVLAEAYVAEGKFRPALHELRKAEAADPNDADIQHDLGLVYLALRQPELAAKSFKRTLDLNPDYVVAINSLGACYMAMNRWDEAIPWFEKILDKLIYATPQFPYLNLGWCYYNKREYEKSVKAYKTALEFDPEFPKAWRGLGRTYAAMGRMDEAVKALNKAVTEAPGFVYAWADLAAAYRKIGQTKKAREALSKIIELAPDSPDAKKARLELGQRP